MSNNDTRTTSRPRYYLTDAETTAIEWASCLQHARREYVKARGIGDARGMDKWADTGTAHKAALLKAMGRITDDRILGIAQAVMFQGYEGGDRAMEQTHDASADCPEGNDGILSLFINICPRTGRTTA